MDIFRVIYCACVLALFYFGGCESLQLRSIQTPETPALGNNTLTITCEYTKEATDNVFTFTLKRKSPGQSAYETIVTYIVSGKTVRYGTVANIESRTTANFTDVGDYPFLQFSSILCDDKADYMWESSFLDVTDVAAKNATFNVKVKALTTFETDSEPVIVSPSTPAVEGDTLTFQCKGDVGNEPVGHLGWFYYLNNATSGGIDISAQAVPSAPQDNPNRACSKERTSVLSLNMTRTLNQVVVRCTVQQNKQDEFGEGYRQTERIMVLYGPSMPTITSNPPRYSFTVGENVTLQCGADANPSAQFYWRLPDNSSVMDSTVALADLTEDHTGDYLCFAYNEIKGTNYTKSHSVTLTITEPTTTTTPPTTTPQSNTDPNGGKTQPATEDDEDDKNTIIIAVCVTVAVVIIIAIIVVVLCIKKKRKNVEEPIKVKNNQGLSSYSGRPDLVSADYAKNNAQSMNASFNNSFDSTDTKPKNEDGLLYLDLTFDDKPRSRRPIQIYDNTAANTSYSDITMPRV